MILESLGSTNIGNLNLDEPIKPERLEFDPERDTLPIDRQFDFPVFRNLIDSGISPELTADYAAAVKIVFPEKLKEFSLKDKFSETLIHYYRGMNFIRDYNPELPNSLIKVIKVASNIKLLFPEQMEDFVIQSFTQGILGIGCALDQKIFFNIYGKNPGLYLEMLAAMAILLKPADPMRQELKLDERYKTLTGQNTQLDFSVSLKEVEEFAGNLAKLRIIYPDFHPTINPESWNVLRFHILDRSGFQEYMEYIAALKILAAKEVRIGEEGIELVMPNTDFNPAPTPALPEVRKF